VMSLKSAIVMYRVDGVSGLNVLTGIIAKVFLSATSKSASHQSCFCGKSVIGPQTCRPDDLLRATRSGQAIRSKIERKRFFEEI